MPLLSHIPALNQNLEITKYQITLEIETPWNPHSWDFKDMLEIGDDEELIVVDIEEIEWQLLKEI